MHNYYLMQKKQFYTCLFVLLLSLNNKAQAQTTKLIVLDIDTNNSISWVNVIKINNDGVKSLSTTDEKGRCSINLSYVDTIHLSYIGYESDTIILSADKSLYQENDITAHMNPMSININEVTIIGNNHWKYQNIGNVNTKRTKNFLGIIANPNFKIAKHFKNTDTTKSSILDMIYLAFYVKHAKHMSPVKIHILTLGDGGLPSGKLTEPIYLPIEKIKKNTKIDVSELKINFPDNGIVIALEWSPKYIKVKDKGGINVRPFITTSNDDPNTVTFTWQQSKYGWKQDRSYKKRNYRIGMKIKTFE